MIIVGLYDHDDIVKDCR